MSAVVTSGKIRGMAVGTAHIRTGIDPIITDIMDITTRGITITVGRPTTIIRIIRIVQIIGIIIIGQINTIIIHQLIPKITGVHNKLPMTATAAKHQHSIVPEVTETRQAAQLRTTEERHHLSQIQENTTTHIQMLEP